jgi:hypothetical protein
MTGTASRPGTVRRPAAAVAAAALAGLGMLAGPPTPAVAAEPCVGVVVDARLLGADVSTSCATGDPGSGLEALTKAGYAYAFVPRQPGQVCQIDGAPACSDTSTDTYWSYWWRAKGSSRWVYATEGAATHDPEPGAIEAWVWQDGGRREPPDIALSRICPQVAEPRPTTATPDRTASRAPAPARSSSPTQSSATAAGGGGSGRTSSSRSAGATAEATGRATPTAAPPTAGGTTSGSPADLGLTATPSQTPVASSAAPDDGGAPSWAGVALGGGLIAVLGGAALARSRRGDGP